MLECGGSLDGETATVTPALTMPVNVTEDPAGFFASDRLRLVSKQWLPEVQSEDAMPFWLPTMQTIETKKTYTSSEFLHVYVPQSSTVLKDWDKKHTVIVWILRPDTILRPGASCVAQVVNPAHLLPVPAARLYDRVHLPGKRSSAQQIQAVQAMVPEFYKGTFLTYLYVLDQISRSPPVEFLKPHSEAWAKATLEKVDFMNAKLHKEETLVLVNLPPGTKMWLQYNGTLHAGLVYGSKVSITTDVICVRAEAKPAVNEAESSSPITTPAEAAPCTEGEERSSSSNGNEDPRAPFFLNTDFTSFVLGSSFHVVCFSFACFKN